MIQPSANVNVNVNVFTLRIHLFGHNNHSTFLTSFYVCLYTIQSETSTASENTKYICFIFFNIISLVSLDVSIMAYWEDSSPLLAISVEFFSDGSRVQPLVSSNLFGKYFFSNMPKIFPGHCGVWSRVVPFQCCCSFCPVFECTDKTQAHYHPPRSCKHFRRCNSTNN